MPETFHLRADRQQVRDTIASAIESTYLVSRSEMPGVVDAVMADLDRLIVRTAALDSKPRLHRGASEAQRLTVDELAGSISDKRKDMLRRIAAYPDGATCDHLEAKHGLAHSSASAQLNWLERQGLVYRDHDDKRKTRAGGTANPYHLSEAGAVLLGKVDADA